MNSFELVEFIDKLSDRDTKSLSEKALKTAEEVGELARAVLAYDGTSGSGHRLASRSNIVEEVADIMLCAYSVARGVGASTNEIKDMISKKALYWETLQKNEVGLNLKALQFEIHVTVERVEDLSTFREVCLILGVKPIMLDLYHEGTPINQIMTSSKFTGTTAAVQDEVLRISNYMEACDFKVVRRKVESIPEHPHAAWAVRQGVAGPNRYYEAHIAFADISDAARSLFRAKHGIHFSRNLMKSGESTVVMGTLRSMIADKTLLEFRDDLEKVLAIAKLSGEVVTGNPRIVEYAIFDDNVADDSGWMQQA